MGTEKRQTVVQNAKQTKLAAPPGFAALTSFTLKRLKNTEETHKSKVLVGDKSELAQTDIKLEISHRPWILYDQTRHGPEQSECEHTEMVTTKLQAEEDCSNVLEEAPIFYPTEEEFKDTLKFIASIQTEAETYGICRIRPLFWEPPYFIMEKNVRENIKFSTHIQKTKEFQRLNSNENAGEEHEKTNVKRRKIDDVTEGLKFESGAMFTLDTFRIYADKFKEHLFHSTGKTTISEGNFSIPEKHNEPSVEKVEDEYRRIIANCSGETKVIYGADLESGILGSGFPVASNSAIKPEHLKYVEIGWNLNNVSMLPGSLLAFESNRTSSCLLPQLSVGMCLSSHCWKVEEHHLYSLCYLHHGDPKVWYGVPGKHFIRFKAAMKKYFPDHCVESPNVTAAHLPPSILKSEGIPVYRCVQYPGEFVVIFPGAYHSGFNCGFNCSEKTLFAPIDWLPHGQNVVELYGHIGKKTLISHDKLLIGAAMKAVKAKWEISLVEKRSEDNLIWEAVCGKDGMLVKALKSRIKEEALRREYLCNPSQVQIMKPDFDSTIKRECIICNYDLHLSASGCASCPDKYTCLRHSKELCSCPWSTRIFIFRYSIGELNILLDAVEGKLSAVYRWAKVHLGLRVSSSTAMDK